MNYTVQGSAVPLAWFEQRLVSQGLPTLRAASRLPAWLPTNWQGIYLHDHAHPYWLDIGLNDQYTLQQRLTLCQQHQLPLIELNGLWQTFGQQFGFMLLVGQEQPCLPPLRQLLNALAPAPEAWLPCGPLGSARFTRQVWDSLLFASRNALPELPQALQVTHWEHLLWQQWELAQQLQQYARDYLSHQDLPMQDANWQEQFALPPRLQAHYAANLARLILFFKLS